MKDKFCPSCGEKNNEAANFCVNCGTKLEQATAKKNKGKSKQPKSSQQKSNSYFILAFAFLFAIVTIFLVLDSNRESFHKKLASKVDQAPQNNPDLNKMMNAVQELRKALDADPENYDLNVKMANSFFDIGRYSEAIKHYQTALKKRKTDPDVLIDLAVAYFNSNKADSALDYINDALVIQPNHPQGLYNAGIIHFNLGDSLTAVQIWEKLIDSNSSSPQAKTAKKFIDQIKSKLIKS